MMGTPAPQDESPAMTLLRAVWDATGLATRRDRRRVLRVTLEQAIRGRVRFHPQDFGWLTTNTRPSYHDLTPFGRDWLGGPEDLYRLSIVHRNPSASKAIETWRGRRPFWWHGQRLYVGQSLRWAGARVAVTNFNDEAGLIVLTQYADAPGGHECPACETWHLTYTKPRIVHLYRVTPEALQAAEQPKEVHSHA